MDTLRTWVTKDGLLIPKEWLVGITEVMIRREANTLLIMPISPDDPIFELGQTPVEADVTDASVNLDQYVYNL